MTTLPTLYSLTIYVNLALLAIVIATFVFASSIHGGALKISAEEEENYLARRRQRIEEGKESISKEVKSLANDRFIQELKAKIVKLDNDLKRIDRSILEARNKGKALTVMNMVTTPSSFLLISIVASGIAIITSGILPIIMWSLSLILIVIGLYFIYRNLITVEGFSSVIDLSTAIEQALERHEMKLKHVTDISKGIQEDVETTLITLPPQARRIVDMYFGISSNRRSIRQIADEFGLTENSAYGRLVGALRMSRHPSRSRNLKKYLDDVPIIGDKTGEQLFIEGIFEGISDE